MSIVSKIGPHSTSRLQRAAEQRFVEAECLMERRHYLAALYFYGYVAEIVLGCAYFRMRGYSPTDAITMSELRRILNTAKMKSRMEDKSHPIDGWAVLLIEERAYARRIERSLRDKSLFISENWSPALRYRTITLQKDQIIEIQEQAKWFLVNSQKL